MKVKFFAIGIISSLILLLFAIYSYSGPILIRDNRITDIALTPTLGRGYTLVTNTFQSKCLSDIVTTEPSYDFQYRFDSLDLSSVTDVSAGSGGGANLTYAIYSGNIGAQFTMSGNVKNYFHRVIVSINMETYYASVDESQSNLSPSAVKMLKNKDIPGFFMSCGSYYVRSLGRNAKFISLFTYQDTSVSADIAFEASMKVAISGFGGESACPGSVVDDCGAAAGGGAALKLPGVGGGGAVKRTASFRQSLSAKRLTIETHAYGLGKNKSATLISYDLETFRAAIKDAFKSMQNAQTGKVKTMEVVPWVENTEFQSLIEIETQKSPSGEEIPLFEKKHILNLNGELLSEIERADRNMINNYYEAKLCKQDIETNYMEVDPSGKGQPKFLEGYQGKRVFNHKSKSADMTLGALYKLVQNPRPLLDKERQFMDQSAKACINEMLETHMYTKSWRDMSSCNKAEAELSAVGNRTIEDHCLPIIAPPPLKSVTAPSKATP